MDRNEHIIKLENAKGLCFCARDSSKLPESFKQPLLLKAYLNN